jgi:hypothetical protein
VPISKLSRGLRDRRRSSLETCKFDGILESRAQHEKHHQ